jgi:hypothetical protein
LKEDPLQLAVGLSVLKEQQQGQPKPGTGEEVIAIGSESLAAVRQNASEVVSNLVCQSLDHLVRL